MGENLVSIFYQQAERKRDSTALRKKAEGEYVDISWREFSGAVSSLAGCLVDLGVEEGDRVAIYGYNSPEWAYTDLAALAVRAAAVPIYFKSSAPQVEYILRDSGARVIMVSGEERLETVLSVKGALPDLRYILAPGKIGDGKGGMVIDLERCLSGGVKDERREEVLRRREGIDEEDTATIVYTSGTTGEPKGVMLTHSNIIHDARCGMEIVDLREDDVGLSFLPTSHVLDRVVVHYMNILAGGTVAYAEGIETILGDVQLVKPTAMCGVPRMFEKIYAAIHDNVNAGPSSKRRIFNWAEEVGRKVVLCRRDYRKPGPFLRLEYRLADRLVYAKIRQLFGGRMRVFASGGAHLQEHIDIFFRAIGIPIMHGYGLTEATCTVTLNTLDDFMPGTLGHPYPGVEVAIAEDGEILVKGAIVMKGYYKLPEATAEAIKDGWLHTGDLGCLDKDGYLLMTDRKKDILVTSGGKNISPQKIETLLKFNRLVEQVAVVAEGKRFVSALIVPSFAELGGFCSRSGIEYTSPEEMVERSEVRELFQGIVEEANRQLDSFERVKKFTLLPREFAEESGELTSTLKVKRRVIDERYREIIDAMYELTPEERGGSGRPLEAS
jgi:long-chain acyl-CoA synthetase